MSSFSNWIPFKKEHEPFLERNKMSIVLLLKLKGLIKTLWSRFGKIHSNIYLSDWTNYLLRIGLL